MEINSFVCCVLSLIIVQMHRTWNVLCLGHTRRKAFFIISLNSFRECVVKLEGDFSRERQTKNGLLFVVWTIFWHFVNILSISGRQKHRSDFGSIWRFIENSQQNLPCVTNPLQYSSRSQVPIRNSLEFKKNNFKLVSLLQHNTNNRFFRSFKNKYFTIVLSLRFLFCAISQFYL